MRSTVAAYCLLASVIGMGSAAAAECPGNPGALGTSRTITVDPTEHQFLGAFQYRESLPLNDREVVITFDDGPLPPYSSRILDVLRSECVKATYFMVGRMARAYPQLVKRTHAEGHTLANHSQNHPFTFHRMTVEQARQEIQERFGLPARAEGQGLTLEVANGHEFIPGLVSGLRTQILSVSLRRPTLDDVFLKLTGREIRDSELSGRDIVREHLRQFSRPRGGHG